MTFCYTEPRESLGNIQTPPFVADFLFNLLKHLKPNVVLDPCCGVGNLLAPWYSSAITIGIDKDADLLLQSSKVCSKQFLSSFENTTLEFYDPRPDLVMLNAPWNRHWKRGASYPEVFLQKVVDLFGNKIPICFLCPMGFRLNQRSRSKRKKWVAQTLEISSIISCPIDLYPDTEFHSEIILFNVKKVKPHYWMPNEQESIGRDH